MAAISGVTGSVTFASGYVTNAFQWEIEGTAEELDTTPFSPTSGYATMTTGLKRWRGSYQCYVDDTTAQPLPALTGAATFVAVTGRQYSGTIHVTSTRTSVSVDGSQRMMTITFVGDGALTGA